MARWHIGDVYPATATFKNAAGTPTNPTTVVLKIQKPDATILTVTPTSDGAGVYHYNISLDQDRQWWFKFFGTGAVATAEPLGFYVTRSRGLD